MNIQFPTNNNGLRLRLVRDFATLVRANVILVCAVFDFVLVAGTHAAETSAQSLKIGDKIERTLAPSEAHLFIVALHTEDLARAVLERTAFSTKAIVYGPDGGEVRRFAKPTDTKKIKVDFVAETEGNYRLEIRSPDATTPTKYTLSLASVVSLEQRVAPAPNQPQSSARLKRLQDDLGAGKSEALADFWQEVERTGTPLVEKIANDSRHVRCTFLWRDNGHTRNVVVGINDGDPQTDFAMTRLGQTDIWAATVKMRAGARFDYQLAANVPAFSTTIPNLNSPSEKKDWFAAAARTDPLNHHPYPFFDEDEASKFQVSSVVELPGAPAQPWADVRPNVPHGTVTSHQFTSAKLKNERRISIYTPPGYRRDAAPYPVLVLCDEKFYLRHVPAPATLDNLLADSRIPPMLAVLVDNGPGNARSTELPCNPTFADFLSDELLPWVRDSYNITQDPAQTIVGGLSYGGLASTFAALRHPEAFGNVLSQSGSYWWTPQNYPGTTPKEKDPYAEPSYVAGLFLAQPRLPIRFYMDAGAHERDFSGHGGHILVPNRHLRDVLRAKGYEVKYQEFIGGHDALSWRGTFADGLIALAGKPAADATNPTPARPHENPVSHR